MKRQRCQSLVTIVLFLAIGPGSAIAEQRGKEYRIGDRGPAGGLVFYDKGNNSGGWRYLEAAPEDQMKSATWGCLKPVHTRGISTAIGTGRNNTGLIIKFCGAKDEAVTICTRYRGGGRDDWFLPSKEELNLMYINLKKNGLGGFSDDNYWSSSIYIEGNVWTQYFGNGRQSDWPPIGNFARVRAIRAF